MKNFTEGGLMLKTSIKKLLNFAEQVMQTIFSLLKVIIFYKKTYIPPQKKRDCLVIANGITLNDSLFKLGENLSDFDKIVMNSIANENIYTQLKPEYYVLADPEFFSKKSVVNIKTKTLKLKNNIVDKTTWKMTLFIPWKIIDNQKEVQAFFAKNKCISLCFFNITPVTGFEKIKFFCYKYNLGMPFLINTLVAAIYLSINMNYKRIFLLGAENNWFNSMFVGEDNNLYIPKQYFDKTGKKETAIVYSDEREIKKHAIWEAFYDLYILFSNYHILNRYSTYKSAKILNATPGSAIDAFERVTDIV